MIISCLSVNKDAINDDVLTLDEEDWIQYDVKQDDMVDGGPFDDVDNV